jgi:hypothetical protein
MVLQARRFLNNPGLEAWFFLLDASQPLPLTRRATAAVILSGDIQKISAPALRATT